MDGHEKIKRALQLLLRLANGRQHTKSELCESLDLSDRTVSRYIATYREVGFSVICKHSLYYIPRMNNAMIDLKDMLYFTKEEAHVLKKAIHGIDNGNVLKNGLEKKLLELYDLDKHIDIKDHPNFSNSIETINKAIKDKKQVILQQYRSSNGKIIRDRLVEPIDFISDYNLFWVFEPESHLCKVFKTSRIGSVLMLDKQYEHENLHKKSLTDVFNMNGDKQTMVKLKISLLAYNMLIEEYPASVGYLKPTKENYWFFEAPVSSFAGVARFCMGLCDDIEIQKPKELKEYIVKKIKKVYNLKMTEVVS